jgi:hypothetical protein
VDSSLQPGTGFFAMVCKLYGYFLDCSVNFSYSKWTEWFLLLLVKTNLSKKVSSGNPRRKSYNSRLKGNVAPVEMALKWYGWSGLHSASGVFVLNISAGHRTKQKPTHKATIDSR